MKMPRQASREHLRILGSRVVEFSDGATICRCHYMAFGEHIWKEVRHTDGKQCRLMNRNTRKDDMEFDEYLHVLRKATSGYYLPYLIGL